MLLLLAEKYWVTALSVLALAVRVVVAHPLGRLPASKEIDVFLWEQILLRLRLQKLLLFEGQWFEVITLLVICAVGNIQAHQ